MNNGRPQNGAEKLVWDVFAGREEEARAQFSRLRLGNMLSAEPKQRRPRSSMLVKLAAFTCALFMLGSWAGNLSVPGYDDGQQITIELPADWVPDQYPFWAAVFSNHAEKLLDHGGHSLVVDYSQNGEGRYFIQLGLIGVDYQQANEWIRAVMDAEPEVGALQYSIDQPPVRYRVRVAEMIAFKLGSIETIERNVVLAWLSAQHPAPRKASAQPPSEGGMQVRHVYLIAQPQDYAKRVSMLDF